MDNNNTQDSFENEFNLQIQKKFISLLIFDKAWAEINGLDVVKPELFENNTLKNICSWIHKHYKKYKTSKEIQAIRPIRQTILITGEIAEDITYYYATSEQIPSSVALGVLMNKDNTVRQAGGFMIQLMPGAGDETAEALEKKIGEIDGITSMLDKGMSPEDILTYILGDFGLRINERTDCSYRCDCSRERVLRALLSIGKKDLEEMIEENKDVEMECHFCGRKYTFTPEELKELVKEAEI